MGSLIVGKAIRRAALLIASGLALTGCLRSQDAAYYGSREAIPLPAARSEQVLLSHVETAAEAKARSALVSPTRAVSRGLFALPRTGPAHIEAYLTGQAPMPARTAGVDIGDLSRVYQRNNFDPIWYGPRGWLPSAEILISTFNAAKLDGLVPTEYLPADRGLPSGGLSGAQLSQIDLELTAGLLRYIRDVKEGRFNPNPRLDASAELMIGLKSRDFERWISGLAPQTPYYSKMKAAAQRDIVYLSAAEFVTYRVNMERLRWQEPRLPTSGRWVLLNVGAAELMAMEGNEPVLGVNVVVGRPTRRTPLNNDKITGLKFSPDWTAPYSIVEKDLVPLALEKGPDFLNQMGLSIFKGERRISPFDLDFNNINVRDYVWKQESGPQNVLGGVRFNLANSSSIYMHDSPDDSLFELPERAHSSGCIRVGASEHFAHWLLSGDQPGGFTLQDVVARMTAGTITHVSLNQDVPVHTIYYNAWPSHDGELVIMPDIYEQNTQLRDRMGYPVGATSLTSGRLGGVTDIGDIF